MKPILTSVLVIILTLRGIRAQTVTQPEDHISVLKGTSMQVKCNYEYSGSPYLFWYVQYPKHSLQFLLKHISRGSTKGFTADLNQSEASFHLKKQVAQEEDSAVYYCALSSYYGSAANKLTFGTGTLLSVQPNIENPDPAVYQLRSPESSNTSICLFTDFDSKTNVSQATGSSVFASNSTVLDMQSTHSKSYGALHWSDKADFGCQDTFSETFYPSSEFSCDVTSVEKSFETDMNLNFQNLSVIGFRILLLKVAGFNLLMTLRLWSS